MKNIRKYFVRGIYSFDIVGFLDTTLLKTGKEGYLFTVDGVYYKEFLEKPGHFRYNDRCRWTRCSTWPPHWMCRPTSSCNSTSDVFIRPQYTT